MYLYPRTYIFSAGIEDRYVPCLYQAIIPWEKTYRVRVTSIDWRTRRRSISLYLRAYAEFIIKLGLIFTAHHPVCNNCGMYGRMFESLGREKKWKKKSLHCWKYWSKILLQSNLKRSEKSEWYLQLLFMRTVRKLLLKFFQVKSTKFLFRNNFKSKKKEFNYNINWWVFISQK